MTIIELEKYVDDLYRANADELTVCNLDGLVAEVKQYGLDLTITKELITAYENETLKAYCEDRI